MASAVPACVAGAKGEGKGSGRKAQKWGKGNPPPSFPSSLSPTLLTPATQAIAVQNRIYGRLQPCVSEMSSWKVRGKVGNFKLKLIKILASAIIVNRRAGCYQTSCSEEGRGGYPIPQYRKKNCQILKFRVENRRNTETALMIGHAYLKLYPPRVFVYLTHLCTSNQPQPIRRNVRRPPIDRYGDRERCLTNFIMD